MQKTRIIERGGNVETKPRSKPKIDLSIIQSSIEKSANFVFVFLFSVLKCLVHISFQWLTIVWSISKDHGFVTRCQVLVKWYPRSTWACVLKSALWCIGWVNHFPKITIKMLHMRRQCQHIACECSHSCQYFHCLLLIDLWIFWSIDLSTNHQKKCPCWEVIFGDFILPFYWFQLDLERRIWLLD